MRKLEALIVTSLISLFGALPLSFARGFGRCIGHCVNLANAKILRVTRLNLSIAYPEMDEAKREQLARQSVIETIVLAFEIFVIGNRSFEWLQKKIFKVEGAELVGETLGEERGVVILAPHLGNWEVLGLFLKTLGSVTSLYQPPKKPYIEAYSKKMREKSGANLVPTSHKGVVKILKALKKGEISGILPDQNPDDGSGEFAPFFGQKANTMTLVHGLLKKTESKAIFGLAKRVPRGFEIYFFEAPAEIYDLNPYESVCALNKGVEQAITYCPAQYQWEYKRFKKDKKIEYKV